MNRIQQQPPQTSPSTVSSTIEHGWLKTDQRRGLLYSLFAPLHYEPNYAYPLLVWLHGPGDDERQLQRIMPLISMRNYVAVGPRATAKASEHACGFHWRQDESDVESAEQRVSECVQIARERFHIHSKRIFLAGLQCGGTMAYRIALRHPHRFAGALSIGGPFPQGRNPLARLQEARKLPLFLAYGRDAVWYSVQHACDDLRLFHVAGMSVSLRQYPCGDDLTTQMLHDVDVWMMERVTGQSMSPAGNPPCDNEFN